MLAIWVRWSDKNVKEWAEKNLEKYDVQLLADTFESFRNGTLEDAQGFCAVKTLDDIAQQDYILTPGRYVGIVDAEDDGEPFEEKMERLTQELSSLLREGYQLDDRIRQSLASVGFELE